MRSNIWQCHGEYVMIATSLFRTPLEGIVDARSRLFYYRTYFINKPCPFVGWSLVKFPEGCSTKGCFEERKMLAFAVRRLGARLQG